MTLSVANLPGEYTSSTRIELMLRGGSAPACQARERVAALNGMTPRSVRAVVLLLLTELVTNAVRHGGASSGLPVEVVVARSPRGLRVAVTYPGAGFEWRDRERTAVCEASGYGLFLVDRMASRWGIEREQSSATVWFELSPN